MKNLLKVLFVIGVIVFVVSCAMGTGSGVSPVEKVNSEAAVITDSTVIMPVDGIIEMSRAKFLATKVAGFDYVVKVYNRYSYYNLENNNLVHKLTLPNALHTRDGNFMLSRVKDDSYPYNDHLQIFEKREGEILMINDFNVEKYTFDNFEFIKDVFTDSVYVLGDTGYQGKIIDLNGKVLFSTMHKFNGFVEKSTVEHVSYEGVKKTKIKPSKLDLTTVVSISQPVQTWSGESLRFESIDDLNKFLGGKPEFISIDQFGFSYVVPLGKKIKYSWSNYFEKGQDRERYAYYQLENGLLVQKFVLDDPLFEIKDNYVYCKREMKDSDKTRKSIYELNGTRITSYYSYGKETVLFLKDQFDNDKTYAMIHTEKNEAEVIGSNGEVLLKTSDKILSFISKGTLLVEPNYGPAKQVDLFAEKK